MVMNNKNPNTEPSTGNSPNPDVEKWEDVLSDVKPADSPVLEDSNDHNDSENALSDEEIKQLKKELLDFYNQDAKDWSKDISELEDQFRAQIKRCKERGQSTVPKEEFEEWEDCFRIEWRIIQNALYARLDKRFKGLTDSDATSLQQLEADFTKTISLQFSTGKKLNETIEAYSGNYYDERSRDLVNAIRNSDLSDDEKQQKIDYARNFWSAVLNHLDVMHQDMNNRTPDVLEAKRLDERRSNAHDDVIEYLNNLNDMAQEFHVRPFTPRYFWPKRRIDKNNATPEVDSRVKYDRYVVQAFYENAFRYEIRDYYRQMAKLGNEY